MGKDEEIRGLRVALRKATDHCLQEQARKHKPACTGKYSAGVYSHKYITDS